MNVRPCWANVHVVDCISSSQPLLSMQRHKSQQIQFFTMCTTQYVTDLTKTVRGNTQKHEKVSAGKELLNHKQFAKSKRRTKFLKVNYQESQANRVITRTWWHVMSRCWLCQICFSDTLQNV